MTVAAAVLFCLAAMIWINFAHDVVFLAVSDRPGFRLKFSLLVLNTMLLLAIMIWALAGLPYRILFDVAFRSGT